MESDDEPSADVSQCSGEDSRLSICFSTPSPDVIILPRSEGFDAEIQKHYTSAENEALKKLIQLQHRMRTASSDQFWSAVTEGLADLCGAQCALISKRILIDDQNLAVEMPPIGEPGSCLMANAIFFELDDGTKQTIRNYKHHAFRSPCAYMRHEKVFLIPGQFGTFLENPANEIPIHPEAYLGLPLFYEGKCFAHFGVMWTAKGVRQKRLSWAMLEALLHAMEDIILQRLVEGVGFEAVPEQRKDRIIPHGAVSTTQSLKPYARSLSHELRTPMQGIVGMLDLMHVELQEAMGAEPSQRIRTIYENFKESILTIQDSSRRAVEAADNVVQAYEMNMGEEETEEASKDVPPQAHLSRRSSFAASNSEPRPSFFVNGSHLSPPQASSKRPRQDDHDDHYDHGNATKVWVTEDVPSTHSNHPAHGSYDLENTSELRREWTTRKRAPGMPQMEARHVDTATSDPARTATPALRQTNLAEILQNVVNESLRSGGRPESAIARDTELGEIIEVRNTSQNGREKVKIVEWSVDPNVPQIISIDEKDLIKILSCLMNNAMKFCETGSITVVARVKQGSKAIVVRVKDTGPGIPAAFLPNLFKPFSREDNTLTRQSEGLGLGLLVARGLSRKIGGGLTCVRADTTGPDHGCEFELVFPMTPSDVASKPHSPFCSPAPSARSRNSADVEDQPLDNHIAPRLDPPTSQPLRHINVDNDLLIKEELSVMPLSPSSQSEYPPTLPRRKPSVYRSPRRRKGNAGLERNMARLHPLNFLVAEDNQINRRLLVNMLHKLGYRNVFEAYDGVEAVRQMGIPRREGTEIDMILMDLWMPRMDGYEATERILRKSKDEAGFHDTENDAPNRTPIVLAVTADITDGALERAAEVGMKGYMTKPYKLDDLQRLILEALDAKSPR